MEGLKEHGVAQSIRQTLLLFTLAFIIQASQAEGGIDRNKVLFKYHEEWSEWKLQHSKAYNSTLEELERHLIWLSNRRYIDTHNANSHIFGFKLAMNHLGDVVRGWAHYSITT